MYVIDVDNVNDAYARGVQLLVDHGVKQSSRAGDVLVYPRPVTTVYQSPRRRVLFEPQRDANPFLHLFESLWMLAGRNDARWLDQFVKDFSSRFAEEDGIQHGAYGHRWRQAFGFDQLEVVIDKLKKNPDDRQAVIQMWDCRPDSVEVMDSSYSSPGCNDLKGNWKDRPCNTQIYLRVRESRSVLQGEHYGKNVLDMTVCCRSNDVVWGAYGANAVHFSVLQEYLAAMIGVEVGVYYQISNNYHIYTWILPKLGKPTTCWYRPAWEPTKIVNNPETFDADLERFMEWTADYEHGQPPYEYPGNPWFSNTAEPLFAIAERWRAGDRQTAMDLICDVAVFSFSPDWRIAAYEWMFRRMNKVKEKSANA